MIQNLIGKYRDKNISRWIGSASSGLMISRFFPQEISTPVEQIDDSEKTLEQEGKDEQVKNESTKKEADKQVVDNLVRKSNRCIISISSLFPWDIFPNTINVEESRVTFTFRQFMSSQSHSVDIKDISNVFIESSLFFATLQVVSNTFVQNDVKIGNLSKNEAKKMQMIIEGLRTFVENKIDTSNYEIEELVYKLEELHSVK